MNRYFNYSKYSLFTPEQIITDNYQKLCNQLLSIVKDKELKEKCSEILYEGGYDDFSVNSEMTKNSPFIEQGKRLKFAYLLATNPETFEIISKNNINLFHGTNANALPGILQYGMRSGQKLSEMGITVSTGEEWSRTWAGKQRNFISFTDDLTTAIRYSSILPANTKPQKSSFGILIGLSSNDAQKMKTCYVSFSNLVETGIADDIPLEAIKVILAPKDKVEFVRRLVGDNGIAVNAIDLEQKFYFGVSDLLANYDSEKASELINPKTQSTIKTIFDFNSMKNLAEGRKSSKIKNIYVKIREKFYSRGKINEEYTRDK